MILVICVDDFGDIVMLKNRKQGTNAGVEFVVQWWCEKRNVNNIGLGFVVQWWCIRKKC
jgi:hypothetical protein